MVRIRYIWKNCWN